MQSESPSLLIEPGFTHAGARRSGQGWPSYQPCSMLRPRHTLTASSTPARLVRSARRSEGSPLSGAVQSRHNLVSGRSMDPNHDAVMRIGSEAPKRRTHSISRHESQGADRDSATSNRHRSPVTSIWTRPKLSGAVSIFRSLCRTQNDAVGYNALPHQPPPPRQDRLGLLQSRHRLRCGRRYAPLPEKPGRNRVRHDWSRKASNNRCSGRVRPSDKSWGERLAQLASVFDAVDGSSTRPVSATDVGAVRAPMVRGFLCTHWWIVLASRGWKSRRRRMRHLPQEAASVRPGIAQQRWTTTTAR